jgi:signal transduction histidine kinase
MRDIHEWGRIGLVALLYYLSAQIGLEYSVVGQTVTLVWPASGVALVALIGFGPRMAFGIAIGAFVANATTDISPVTAAIIAVGNTAGAYAASLLLQRVAAFDVAMERASDVIAFIGIAALLTTNISAVVGSAALIFGEGMVPAHFPSIWLKWWLGDMMGVLVIAPPLLVWLGNQAKGRKAVIPSARVAEAMLLIGTLLVAAYVIFLMPGSSGHGNYPSAFAVFPFVIWAALRFETWGASLVTAVIALLAIWGTTHGVGPFAVESPIESLVRWCTFANVLAVTGLLLSAASKESRSVHLALKNSHEALEQQVALRTEELARTNDGLRKEIAERKALEAELLLSSEERRRTMGRDLHDGLGQQLTSIAFFGATLHQQLADQGRPEATISQRIVDLVNQSIETVRAISRGLYPAALESAGLSEALAELAENTSMINRINCRFTEGTPLGNSDPLVAINLYRIAQEALNNAIKHGNAKTLSIELGEANGYCRLIIEDDGTGFQVSDIPDSSQIDRGREGMGLRNMQYRAGLLGGVFSLNRNPHGGSTAAVIFPAI